MGAESKIEWTDATWNPVRGCTKVSPGCKFCYAEAFAERFRGVPGHPFEQGFDLRLVYEALELPLKWRRPRRVFVNSVSDLFHEDVPTDYIRRVFDVMVRAPQHTFQVLTKRSGRLADLSSSLPWAENIWQGVSVESAEYRERIIDLRYLGAAVRFLSCEPLLGDLGTLDLSGIHWVIVGGESGQHARPMHPDWARSIRDQCAAAGVPYFFKQTGRRPVGLTIKSKKGGDWEDIPVDLRIREWPKGRAA